MLLHFMSFNFFAVQNRSTMTYLPRSKTRLPRNARLAPRKKIAMFMGSECVIEKMRGKTDMMNSVYAGCATGAAFGMKQGPSAACFGCVGMAAFSAAMDKLMGH